ncbi:MAG: hypothetical protein IKS49_00260 [Actinomycetaceae bacterium]|nr:hypothetical protein [Actinomycetaceae bacterium]
MSSQGKDMQPSAQDEASVSEWAQEFDTDAPAQRSDSERFDRAVEMGVEAAQSLERDETLGLIPPRRRSRRFPISLLLAGTLALSVAGVAHAPHNDDSASSTQQGQSASRVPIEEKPPVQIEKQPDGSYRAHVTLNPANRLSETQTVEIPEDVVKSDKPWAMSIHGAIDTASAVRISCKPVLFYDDASGAGETVFYSDWCQEAASVSQSNNFIWEGAVGTEDSTDFSDSSQSSVEQVFALPGHFPKVISFGHRETIPKVTFTGAAAQLDVDFLPVEAIAVPWDKSEPVKGSDSMFIAFSGSLDDLALDFDGGTIMLYGYVPSADGADKGGQWSPLLIKSSGYRKDELKLNTKAIDQYGFTRADASGYLFVEVKAKEFAHSPLWWRLS